MMNISKVLKNTLSAGVLTIFVILGGGSLDTDEGAEKISAATPDYVLSADTLLRHMIRTLLLLMLNTRIRL